MPRLLLPAPVKRTEVVKATTPADDVKSLDPAVPESVAISTQFERVVVIRIKKQASLLTAIERHVAEQKIRNAVLTLGVLPDNQSVGLKRFDDKTWRQA
jgi:hypothetical protein